MFDSGARLVRCSTRAERLFETAAAELVGKTPELWQAINIADKKAFEQCLYDVLSGQRALVVRQFTHKLPSREVLLCEWHLSPFRSPTGEPCVLALVRELNSSRRAEAEEGGRRNWFGLRGISNLQFELRRKQEELAQLDTIFREKDSRLIAILRNAPVGICVVNVDGSFTGEMNPAYFNLFGYDATELRQLSLESITHPDDLSRNLELRNDVIEGRLPRAEYEKRYLRKDGGIVWVRAILAPLCDDTGKVYNLIAVVQDITAEREAQMALQQREELIRVGGRVARLGCWMRDLHNGAATFWSDELYDIYEFDGKVPPPLKDVMGLVVPQHQALAMSMLEDISLHGKRSEMECEIVTFRGNRKWIRVAGAPQMDAEGRVNRLIGAVQDISERKAQERETQRLSERITATLDAMPEAFMILNRDWEIVYLNKVAETQLKLSLATTLPGSIWERQPWLRKSPVYPGYVRAMDERVPFHCEYFSERLKDWLEAYAYPCDEGLAIYFHVIGERRRLMARVQESEQKLRYVAKATLDVVWERNLPEDTIRWDGGLRKLGHVSPLEEGKAVTSSLFWLERIHPQEQDAVISSLDGVLKGTVDHWEATYRFRIDDDSYIHVMDRGVVFRDAAHQPVRMIGGMTDITPRIRLEEHLQQSQRIESIGKLTGGLAHDFNNLLTVILGNTELLSMEAGAHIEMQKSIDAINNAALRGADLTKRLLAFARRQALEPAAVNLNRLVLNMQGMLIRSLGGNVDVKIVTSRTLHTALVDSNQLESAILNLCINSRDAMPAGGRITIETMNVTLEEGADGFLDDVLPGDYVAVKVTDTGCGIAPDKIGHVFEPFFTTKELGKGTGLGLSTVYGFMRQSNGYVTIASRVDVGTEVILYLPITMQREKQTSQRQQRDKIHVHGNETILLVEDDAAVSSFSSQYLSSLGYQVITVDNAHKALAVLRVRHDIHLLFTDIIMPGGMDGGELGRQAQLLHPTLLVLYTSGYTDNALIKEGRLDPDVNFLQKPYTLARMAIRIREVLGAPATH